jgi:periplasmic protein TonB
MIFQTPPPQPAPPQPVVVEPPPPPPPPPQVIEAPPPPPPVVRRVVPKPKPPPRHIVRRIERPLPRPQPPPPAVPQTAALPPPPRQAAPAAPPVTAAYRNALAEWFAAHRQYPLSARERGEEGIGVLQLRVDRSGRVLSYALIRSTGYPDLDAAIEATMRDATLPSFPAEMAASENEIAVTIPFRFRLER